MSAIATAGGENWRFGRPRSQGEVLQEWNIEVY
jgi:hypothetical protein